MTRTQSIYCLTLCWLCALAAPAGGDIPDLPRVTDCGGTRSFHSICTGPEAPAGYTYVASTGIVVMGEAGSANYQMQSGYWYHALSPILPDCDLNFDDRADGLDIEPFTALALTGIAGDPFLIVHADFNYNGIIDLVDDLPKFVERLVYGLLPGAANTVCPTPDETGVDPNGVVLRWVAGARARSFDVYFGYDEISVREATKLDPQYYGNTTSTEWVLYPLPPSFSFYWRIDSIGVAGISKGTVWTFTTAP